MEADTKSGALKAGSAWTLVGLSKVGINTWSDFAAVLAAIYTLLLIGDWFWKRWKGHK